MNNNVGLNDYSTNIDDEFASLFLQELQNTRSGSNRNESNIITNEDINNNKNNANNNINNNITENDYLESMNIETDSTNFMMTLGPASYARYLPLETTFSTNMLELNDIDGALLMKKAEDKYNDQLYRSDDNYLTNEEKTISNISILSKNKGNDSITYNPPEDSLIISGSDNPLLSESAQDTQLNLQVLKKILHIILSLMDTNYANRSESIISKLNIKSSISGRLFMDPDTFKNISKYHDLSVSSEIFNSIQLFCYRRNSINVHITLDFAPFLKLNNVPFYKLSLNLFSVLRKKENKNDNKLNIIEDFKFYGSQDKNITSLNKMNTPTISFLYDDLIKNCQSGNTKIQFNWEQIRFNSATASNRHDIDNKYHNIVLELNFYDSQGVNIYNKTIESNPIIVRGRNPRFYSQKGDILIGKIEKLMNELKHSNQLDNIRPQQKRMKLEPNKTTSYQNSIKAFDEDNVIVAEEFQENIPINKDLLTENEQNRHFNANVVNLDSNNFKKTEEVKQFFIDDNHENDDEIDQVDSVAKKEHLVNEVEQQDENFTDEIRYKQYSNYNEAEAEEEDEEEEEEEEEDIDNSFMNSSYQYFKVDDNYYLPPVQVGYFPHHVHHNKQVFKTNVVIPRITNNMENKRQYNYFL